MVGEVSNGVERGGGGCVKPQAETGRGFPFYNIKNLVYVLLTYKLT